MQTTTKETAITLNIAKQVIWTDEVQTINAREIHSFVLSKRSFTDWIKDRVKTFSFTEWIDFITTSWKSTWWRKSIEYIFSIDAGKELALLENNVFFSKIYYTISLKSK